MRHAIALKVVTAALVAMSVTNAGCGRLGYEAQWDAAADAASRDGDASEETTARADAV